MRVFRTDWPNSPALEELGLSGTRTILATSTETRVVAVLNDVCDAVLLCSTPPRFCFRLPSSIRVIDFAGHPVLPAVKQLVAVGRYQIYGDWIWTPELHSLCAVMRSPRPWSLELAQCDGTSGGNTNDSVHPLARGEGRSDKDERGDFGST